MTSTTQQYRPNRLRPRTLQNRIQWVLGQHGINVDDHTVESIWASLTTGDDPRPDGIPAQFMFQGVALIWPAGVSRRLLRPREREALNKALALNHNELLTSEDNADEGRYAYTVLWNKTQQPGYTDPRVDALLAEACENPLCGHRKPNGRLLCLAGAHHEGLHRNGKNAWTDTEVVKVQHYANPTGPVTTRPKSKLERRDERLGLIKGANDDLDDLLAQLNTLTNAL